LQGKEVLNKVNDVLMDIQENKISIEGHTDNVPIGPKLAQRFPTNWELSTARATQVVRYLISLGADTARIGASGFSEYQPVAPNDTPENQQQNRRIEIVLTPERSAQALGGSP
jgi:chemotaxis protein MotB